MSVNYQIMRTAHLIFGIMLAIVFAVTGQFMRADFPDKDVMDPMLRILTRSRHIYILFIALMHVLLGIYLTNAVKTWQRTFQIIGSTLLFVAAFVLVYAWHAETYTYATFSELSRWGIYLTLAGTVLHLFGGIRQKTT